MRTRTGALRRRRKPSLVTRLRILWVFIAFVVGAAAYGGYTLVTLPQLRVHSVQVQLTGSAVSETDVRRAAAIDRRANVWLLDTGAVARRIETIPYVLRADVRRSPPADVTLVVSEREPAACVATGGRVVTIDAAERILQTGCSRPRAVRIDLRDGILGRPGTFVTAPALATLLADQRALGAAPLDVRRLGQDRYGQLVAVGADGVRYYFGNDGDLAQKVKLVGPVLAAARPGHAIRAVDLRAPATPTVQFR